MNPLLQPNPPPLWTGLEPAFSPPPVPPPPTKKYLLARPHPHP